MWQQDMKNGETYEIAATRHQWWLTVPKMMGASLGIGRHIRGQIALSIVRPGLGDQRLIAEIEISSCAADIGPLHFSSIC